MYTYLHKKRRSLITCIYFRIIKQTKCTFHSTYWESKVSTCFEYYLIILRSSCTSGISYIAVKLQPCHRQLTLHARNIPNAVCAGPPEDEHVMLETCRGLWFSINWMKSVSRWFHYTIYYDVRSTKYSVHRFWLQWYLELVCSHDYMF
jgi:hypothetical protein